MDELFEAQLRQRCAELREADQRLTDGVRARAAALDAEDRAMTPAQQAAEQARARRLFRQTYLFRVITQRRASEVPDTNRVRARCPRGARRPRAQASRSSARSGDSGDADGDPEPAGSPRLIAGGRS